MIRKIVLALALFVSLAQAVAAQTPSGGGSGQGGTGVPPTGISIRRSNVGIVNSLAIMPYLTVSYNAYSGKAFPSSAKGVGFGGGLAFDLMQEGSHTGLYFDFAFQDMRGYAQNGSCVHENDSVLDPANAEHYWQYVLFEPFLKLQSGNTHGYFLLGASLGFAVQSETVSRGTKVTEYTLWEGSRDVNGNSYSNPFRFDLRAGLGVMLAKIGAEQLVLEGRVGYPLTNVITGYQNACSGGEIGNWRILTFQVNLGLRV